MRITDIRAIPVRIPTSRRRSGLGQVSELLYAIVVVDTDEGISGVGEISSLWDGAGLVQAAYVDHALTPRLIGEDPRSVERCRHLMATLRPEGWPARAAIEMALFDIAGKAAGLPVYQLLGGRSREWIELSRSVHMDTPERMATEASAHVSSGFSCIKVKVGRGIEEDEEAVAQIRAAIGPDVLLRVDANMAWRSPAVAIRRIRSLERHGLHSVEQPVAAGDFEGLGLVRRAVDTPVMADESLWGPADAWALLTSRAVDYLNVYVAESGGLINASLIFRMAELANVSCVIGAMPETGIGTSAAVHLAASVGLLSDPCDASGVLYQSVDVINESFRVEGGRIWPMEGPGLGVSVNWDLVEEWRA